jgi:5-methylcytosine-specific restriction protein B
MEKQFTWIPFYGELAQQLLSWEERQGELLSLLETMRKKGLKITPFSDQDENGARLPLNEIDPFTFFAVFNRGTGPDQRIRILTALKQLFSLKSAIPDDFNGVPVVNSMSSWFIAYKCDRSKDDVKKLWRVFRLAFDKNPVESPAFLEAFNDALTVRRTNINLTMGLFWIRPDVFLSLDKWIRQYLNIKLPATGLTAEFYKQTILSVPMGKLPSLVSYEAWKSRDKTSTKQPPPSDRNFWLVGAYWSESEPQDQTKRFVDEGIWQNGYEDRLLDEVRSMRVGDKIAIKAASTQKLNLPFNAQGKTVSRMAIKAVGTIVKNRGDGRTVEVEWDEFKGKDWYFYTNRETIWKLRRDEPLAKKLIAFIFADELQDYEWFCNYWYGESKDTSPDQIKDALLPPYSIADVVESGVFLSEMQIKEIIERLATKKNLILQGCPGVGKTFIARKLAFALMEEIDDKRVETVQFHQSYSYEDFIRGYRPLADKAGAFGLQDGIFYKFCQKAKDDPDRDYVFIIDEINRGNLSQIFGELLMLIETDKRGPEFVVPLLYQKKDEPRFYVPQNVYLIGLMNVADRSLALVDYALRRRFAFVSLTPQFSGTEFSKWLSDRNMIPDLINLIISRLTVLNQQITEDTLLGENYQIGHSYFCPRGNNFDGLTREWYEQVIKTEIIPLLKEYWFDNQKRAKEIGETLLAP